MPQEIFKQVNFNVGEIDPRAADRSDLKVYYAAVEYAENLAPLPVGPIVRRPGLTFIDKVRHKLADIPVTAPMISAPEGGVAADALTANGAWFTTTSGMGDGTYVVLVVDFGAPVDVALIDLIDYAASDPSPVAPPDPPPFTYPWPDLGSGDNFGFGGFGDHIGPEIP